MKTKAKLILKSLADLPANSLAMATSVSMRAIETTRHAMTQPMQATRQQVRAARQVSAQFMKGLSERANAPLKIDNCWSHGGLNE